MPNPGFPLDAYIVIDTNAIVGISEYCCSKYTGLVISELIENTSIEIDQMFSAIKRFAIKNRVFTTDCVLEEYKPENGYLKSYEGLQKCHCDHLKGKIQDHIEALKINMNSINLIRQMDKKPSRFGENLSGLSDPDLSLLVLALGIAKNFNERVYIISDEEKLRAFTSWSKSKSEIKELCPCSEKIEALHSMVYLDSVHRHCAITSQQINEIYNFYTLQQLKRKFLNQTTMGEMITDTYERIYHLINESSKIKLSMARGIS
jgi:hypothetical protein